MTTASLRILARITWPNAVITRLWDGSGLYVDDDGEMWKGCGIIEGLDAIEQAMNGEAATLALALSGLAPEEADAAWLEYSNDEIIGATVEIILQPCDEDDDPSGDPETKFTGTIDNIVFNDRVEGDRPMSSVIVECTNRFTIRRLTRGGVLSDTDQKARSAKLNPSAEPDRFGDRVTLMQDKTIVWPRWN